jgi:hypothetical protein
MARQLHTSWRKPITQRDSELIFAIAKRAADELPYSKITVAMDLEAVHEHTPLDLDRLLKADLGDFVHDVVGIYRRIDRKTGRLTNCFSPRFTKVRR